MIFFSQAVVMSFLFDCWLWEDNAFTVMMRLSDKQYNTIYDKIQKDRIWRFYPYRKEKYGRK